MSLTPEQQRQREGKLTASKVAALMSGDDAKLLDLWRELVGDPNYRPVDLSGIWAVQLGSVTEQLNLDWYQRKIGHPVVRRGEVVVHPTYQWAACTLDGWDEIRGIPIECKHVGGREPYGTVLARYQPQMHWQMIVTGTDVCAFSVIEAAREPVIEFVRPDPSYKVTLWQRALSFMECVTTMTPPVEMPKVVAPVKPEATYDMTGNNEWASHAVDYTMNINQSKAAIAAEKAIKAIVPPDAVRAFGHGIEVTRDRASRMHLRTT